MPEPRFAFAAAFDFDPEACFPGLPFDLLADDFDLPDEDAFWRPAYSMVNGTLPAGDLGEGDTSYVQGFVNILAAGAVKLDLNSAEALRLWIDGKEIKDVNAPIHFTRGRKTLTFAIDRKVRGNIGLRVLLVPTDKSVKFKPEGGI